VGHLDQISFQLNPFLGGLIGAVWAAVLLRAAARLSAGAASPWDSGDALWLGLGLGFGLWWAKGGLLNMLVLPALGGAVGGWLARGMEAAVVGVGIGLGLGLGEWVAFRAALAREENALVEE